MNEIKLAYKNPNFFEERPSKVLQLCTFLTPIMNNLHETSYSERFWIMVLGHYVTTCVNRINYLEQDVTEYEIPLQEINSWRPITRKEVIKATITYCLRACKAKGSLKKFLKAVSKQNDICLGMRGQELERLGRGVFCPTVMPLVFLGNRKMRQRLRNIAMNEDGIFLRNLLLQIPRVYVEHFHYLLNKCVVIGNPKDKRFHLEHKEGFFMNLLLAVYSELGSKIYQYQLGGYIGETQSSMSPVKYAALDKHFTYGWKIHEKDEPFYGVRLEGFRDIYEEHLTDTLATKYDIVVIYDSMRNAKNLNHYKLVSSLFFSSIDSEKYPNIILRPRGMSRKVNNIKELYCLDVPVRISIDRGMNPLAELVANSKVVIHWNHPSTNFLECIYVNHPVVAVLTNLNPTDIVIPYYDFFLSVGVMHTNAESLISHLNKIDIQSWWNEIVKMQKYLDFKDTFARGFGLIEAPDYR